MVSCLPTREILFKKLFIILRRLFKRGLIEKLGELQPQDLRKIEGQLLHSEEKILSLHPAVITCALQLPFYLVSHFAGIQAIIESVASAKKVHLIDFSIRSGGHCTALIQALAAQKEFTLQLLKITVVGTTLEQVMRRQVKGWPVFLRL